VLEPGSDYAADLLHLTVVDIGHGESYLDFLLTAG
jgi:hypothetical protein